MKGKMLEVAIATIICIIVLAGCGSKIAGDARQVQEMNEQIQSEQMTPEEERQKETEEMKEFYNELDNRDTEEIVQENKFEEAVVQENIEVEHKDAYHDPDEFSKFVAEILFNFYNRGIKAENYYEFLLKYGSESVIENLPTKEDAIAVYESIQSHYHEQNIMLDSYQITEVKLNHSETEGYFYRKVISTNGTEYFISTIVKENGVWKFLEDGPSPPFEEVENEKYIDEGV